ncbi:unnamed protein product [Chrysoparadoxa australica]
MDLPSPKAHTRAKSTAGTIRNGVYVAQARAGEIAVGPGSYNTEVPGQSLLRTSFNVRVNSGNRGGANATTSSSGSGKVAPAVRRARSRSFGGTGMGRTGKSTSSSPTPPSKAFVTIQDLQDLLDRVDDRKGSRSKSPAKKHTRASTMSPRRSGGSPRLVATAPDEESPRYKPRLKTSSPRKASPTKKKASPKSSPRASPKASPRMEEGSASAAQEEGAQLFIRRSLMPQLRLPEAVATVKSGVGGEPTSEQVEVALTNEV